MHKILDQSAAVYPFRARQDATDLREHSRTSDGHLAPPPRPDPVPLLRRAPANAELVFDAGAERAAIDFHLGRFTEMAQDEHGRCMAEEPFADPDHFAGVLLQAMSSAAGLDPAYTRRVAVALELASDVAFADDSPVSWPMPAPRDRGPCRPSAAGFTVAEWRRALADAYLKASAAGVDRSMTLALRLTGDRFVGQEVRSAMSSALARPERPVPLLDVSRAIDAAAKLGQLAALAIDVLRHRHGPRRPAAFDEQLLVAGHASLALHAAVRLLGLLRLRIERAPSDDREHSQRVQAFVTVAASEIGRRTFAASRAIGALHTKPSVTGALVQMVRAEVRRGRWVCAAS